MADVEHIGVVTVTFNSGKVLEPFLTSLLNQTHVGFTLYVVDNASKDETKAILRQSRDERIVLILNEDNLGVATGNNQGIKAALADGCSHVLLLNNDTEFGPGLLAGLLSAMTTSRADMVVPKMMFFEPRDHIWCAGGAFNKLRGYTARHLGEGELDQGQCDHSMAIEYCPTCCMLINASVFDKIGLMDEAYFVYWDDSDFCFRAQAAGLRLFYEYSLVLYHKVSALTGGNATSFSQRYYTRNKVYFLLKNLGWSGLHHLVLFWIYLMFQPRIMVDHWALRQRSFWEGVKLYRSQFKSPVNH
jgi:hypothetical protein